jgi:rhomboid protease GluP
VTLQWVKVDKRRMCPQCRAFITTSNKVCPYCNTKVGPRAVEQRDPGPILGGLIPHAQFVTSMILLLNFGLYAATAIYSSRSGGGGWMDVDGKTLFAFGAKYRDAIYYGQWWRLVTAGFLHGGAIHILMNSWVLFDVGAQVEQIYGARRLVVIYFVSTVGGFVASTMWSNSLSIGASAGLFGLIGAMIALGVRYKSSVGSAIRGFYMRWAMYGLVIGLLPGIDNAAHVGGLAAGFGCAYLAGLPSIVESLTERAWRIASYAALLATGYSFLQMFLWFRAGA